MILRGHVKEGLLNHKRGHLFGLFFPLFYPTETECCMLFKPKQIEELLTISFFQLQKLVYVVLYCYMIGAESVLLPNETSLCF